MKKQIVQHYMWMAFILLSSILTSCDDSPTNPSNRQLLYESTTSQGRYFAVVQDGEDEYHCKIKVAITGEKDIVIEDVRGFPRYTVPDSVRVHEYVGPPALVHLDWHTRLVSITSEDHYHYLVFPPGLADQILLKGGGTSSYAGYGFFTWKWGEYQLGYANQTLTLQDHLIDGGDRGTICYATESEVFRTYPVSSQLTVSIQQCEKHTRYVEVQFPGNGPCGVSTVQAALANTPWQAAPISSAECTQNIAAR